MAEEQKNPEEEQSTVEDVVETVEETAETVAETIDETADEVQSTIEDTVEEVSETVESAVEATPNAVALATTSTDKQNFMEIGEELTRGHGHVDHHYSDEVVIPYFGHVGTMPGGIYTFIFLVLGALTLIEVLITIIGENAFTITILVLLSILKAYLVIMYYMHLKDDNPIYRLVVILPLIIVLLSTLYLLGVPAGAGLGYS